MTARFDRQLAAQRALAESLGWLSPAIVVEGALYDVAGTGLTRNLDFRGQVEAFHDRWHAYFVSKAFRGEIMKLSDYQELPHFEFREEAISSLTRRVDRGLVCLLASAVTVGLLSGLALGRFRVVD
ncbi:DUF3526 domain-containing protein [Singulisphaera acidiphila]|uniref:DUF3526 domain-containing protein n=1 Tax=Singulisphaera acidiphila TaxID=466153 RepID=UPI0002470F29|nr:DUF3526 domain-containing protein [Singulisphaera acidiphila]